MVWPGRVTIMGTRYAGDWWEVPSDLGTLERGLQVPVWPLRLGQAGFPIDHRAAIRYFTVKGVDKQVNRELMVDEHRTHLLLAFEVVWTRQRQGESSNRVLQLLDLFRRHDTGIGGGGPWCSKTLAG